MNRAGGFRSDVTGNAAGERKLFEQSAHPFLVLGDIRVVLAVRAFEINIGDQRRPAMARTRHIQHVQVVLADDAVEMRVDEVEPGRRAPVTQQARLDVRQLQRLLEQRVVHQIDLTDREIVRGPPVGVEPCQIFRAERGIVASRG